MSDERADFAFAYSCHVWRLSHPSLPSSHRGFPNFLDFPPECRARAYHEHLQEGVRVDNEFWETAEADKKIEKAKIVATEKAAVENSVRLASNAYMRKYRADKKSKIRVSLGLPAISTSGKCLNPLVDKRFYQGE